MVAIARESAVDRELCEIAGVRPGGLRPSQSWGDLAVAVTAVVCEIEIELEDMGELYLLVFRSPTPADGAKALLDYVWDQAVGLTDGDDDAEEP